MKLKEGFLTQQIGDSYMMVPAGSASESFNGLVRSNETAAAIIDLLKKDTTVEEIVSEMLEQYDAPREIIEKDVRMVIEKLQSINALDI